METAESELANGTYSLQERAFEPLKRSDPRSKRHREVRSFAAAPGPDERPRWNGSVKDEAHPFPQNALMHTNSCFNGVDVVATRFPESVKGAAHLRNSRPMGRGVWQENTAKASHSNKYAYHCDALREREPPPSYLAKVIMEEQSDVQLRKRQMWNSSAVQEGHRGNRFVAPEAEPNYLEMNKSKGVLRPETYVKPKDRVTQMTESMRAEKRRKRQAALETPMTLYNQHEQQEFLSSSSGAARSLGTTQGPPVFKMSNIDEWWDMDPVEVAKQQNSTKRQLTDNPYASYRSGFDQSGVDTTAYADSYRETVARKNRPPVLDEESEYN